MLKKLFARKKEEQTKKIKIEYDEEFKIFTCLTSERAKIVVNRCLDLGLEINTQKLQKLMVLMQGKMLSDYDKPFIEEEIKATKCGVMIPKVDNDFMRYAVGCNKKLEEYICLLEREQEVIDSILNSFGNMDTFELNDLLSLKAINSFVLKCEPFTTIPNQLIKKVFSDSAYAQELLTDSKKEEKMI